MIPPTPARAVGTVVVGLLLVSAGAYLTGASWNSPCHDDLAFSAHDRTFDFEQSGDTVTAEFESGEPFTDSNTVSVAFIVENASSGAAERVEWGTNESGAFPITPSDRFHLNQTALETVQLESGTTIRVMWTGYEPQLPWYCLNARDDTVGAVTYARYEVA